MQHRSVLRGVWGFFLIIILLGGGILPAHAQVAADSIRVVVNLAAQQTQQEVKFQLSASSDTNIDQVTLIYGITGHGCTGDGARHPMAITEGTQVLVSWQMTDEFTPGVELWWQWQIHNRAGTTLRTDVNKKTLLDGRFIWQKIEQGQIQLYWYLGSQVFANQLMGIAQQAQTRLANQAGVITENKIRIMVYDSSEQMRAIMPDIAEWAGGVAISENDLILISISPYDTTNWPHEVIPHEIAHLITENGFVNCQAVRLPLWLLEGIAKYAEGPVVWEYRNIVRQALASGNLPPLRKFRYSFPSDTIGARLAYAQSAMLVNYLIETYGNEKMNRLVDAIRAGQSIDQALRPIYGWDTDEIDQVWRASLGYGHAPPQNYIAQTPEATHTAIPTFDLHPVVGTQKPVLTQTIPPSATPLVAQTITPTPILMSSTTAIIPQPAKTNLTTPFQPTIKTIMQTLLAIFMGGLGMAVVIAAVALWMMVHKS